MQDEEVEVRRPAKLPSKSSTVLSCMPGAIGSAGRSRPSWKAQSRISPSCIGEEDKEVKGPDEAAVGDESGNIVVGASCLLWVHVGVVPWSTYGERPIKEREGVSERPQKLPHGSLFEASNALGQPHASADRSNAAEILAARSRPRADDVGCGSPCGRAHMWPPPGAEGSCRSS